MQDWDTRIKNLKADIEIARQKYVVPFSKSQSNVPPIAKEVNQASNPTTPSLDNNVQNSSEKLYENKDPSSSLDLINKTNEVSPASDTGLTQEITNKIDNQLENNASADAAPTVDVNEAVASADAAPIVDINEAVASADAAPIVDINEVVASADTAPTVDAVEDLPTEQDSSEGEGKKTELELLEERDENDLSEDEEDRMYELRRLRAQKKMNNEVRETEQEELNKADEEIAHLKTLLKPKPKKLPKGYIA